MGLYDDLVPTDAEQKLIAAAARGKVCDFTDGGKLDSDAKNGASWGLERWVRAEVIVALTTLARADWPVAAKGVRLLGARIEGALDFEEATLDRSLWLWRCHIGETVALRRARARAVSLQGCFLKPRAGRAIVANDLRCDGPLFLRDSKIIGEVFMLSAAIAGDFSCKGATFEAAQGGNGKAFSADRMTVEGGAFLGNINAKGEVRLLGAKIGGNLECQGATFAAVEGSDGKAFSTDRIAVEGGVFLGNIDARGEVRLLGAKINGNLDCEGATFAVAESGDGSAFEAEGMTVEGSLSWRNIERVSDIVDLTHAKVGQLTDDAKSWQGISALFIDGFEYGALVNAPTDFRTRLVWLAKMPTVYFWPQPYEQLVKVLRQMGHEHDARQIAIAKQNAYREKVKLRPLNRVWLRVFKATVSYGYEPWKALYWIAGWIIVGMIAFFLAFEIGAMHPSKERVFMSECYATTDFESARRLGKCEGWEKVGRSMINKPLYMPTDYPRFQSLVYSIDVFLPFVDLHQESYWLPSDKRWGLLALVYFWLHIAVGWFLATMFIVGFTNIVKKD